MLHCSAKTLLCVGVAFIALAALASAASPNKILMKDGKTLTLFGNRMTAARRGNPIPQLKCIGSKNLCNDRYMPSAVQCYNKGSNGADIQWKCEAELDKDVAFDAVHVSCEGYYAPDDDYILEGSCGLEYRLKFTNAYKDAQNTRNNVPPQQTQDQRRATYVNTQSSTEDDGSFFKFFLFICLVVIVLTWYCKKPRNENGERRVPPVQTAPHMEDFLPPNNPFTSHSSGNPYAQTARGFPNSASADYCAPSSTSAQNAQSGPGFLTGVAVGAMGGAAATHFAHRRAAQTDTSTSSTASTFDRRHDDHNHNVPSGTSSTDDHSGETHTSTGFGSSSRR